MLGHQAVLTHSVQGNLLLYRFFFYSYSNLTKMRKQKAGKPDDIYSLFFIALFRGFVVFSVIVCGVVVCGVVKLLHSPHSQKMGISQSS